MPATETVLQLARLSLLTVGGSPAYGCRVTVIEDGLAAGNIPPPISRLRPLTGIPEQPVTPPAKEGLACVNPRARMSLRAIAILNGHIAGGNVCNKAGIPCQEVQGGDIEMKLMSVIRKITAGLFLVVCLLALTSTRSIASVPQRKNRPAEVPNRAAAKEAEQRLSDMGYWTGPIDGVIDRDSRAALIAFQKVEGRKSTGRLTNDEVEAIRNATPPQAKELGYAHVEVDLERQVFLLVDEEGKVSRILPVSSGSNKHYNEKGMSGIAYTPRGRFRVYAKASGWKRSPLGLLYYPNYISGGVAIHGNPEVPTEPESHGCIRIPMFASEEVSKLLPVGMIVLVYDKKSFVSAKAWAEADKVKGVATTQ